MSSRVSLPGARRTKRAAGARQRASRATPLDPARPLWQFHLVDNYDGGSALIARIHHCYADGIALVRVMLSMTDAAPQRPAGDAVRTPRRTRRRAATTIRSRSCCSRSSGVMKIARKVGATLIEKGAAIWYDPAKAVALAEQGGALTAEIAKLALMPQDSPTRFKGKPGVAQAVAWADPLPLDEVKTVGQGARRVGQRRAAVVRRRRAARLSRATRATRPTA